MDNKLRIASMLVAHRYAKNLTQVKVSKKLGVTFQQVQKYERMINKITSDKLVEFCNALDVRLQSFQDGDPFQVLDGADISILKKEKALSIIEILFSQHETNILISKKIKENTHDQSASR
jgi:transcriptional regulator with XRE-family HTH domain